MLDIESELLALLKGFDAAGVPYALCGALALAVHGCPRATKDIDIVVPAANIPAAKAVARACGFALEALPMRFRSSGVSIERVSKLVNGRDLLMLDVLVGDETLEGVWESRIGMPWQGRQLWTVSKPALVSMKLQAGRPQDLADVARLQEIS